MEKEARFEALMNESLLQYYYRCCGPTYSIMIPLLAFIAFVLVVLILAKGKGPTVGPALVLTAPMAAYFGLYGTIGGLLATARIVEQSGTDPDPWMLWSGVGSSLVTFMLGMMLSIPAFLTAVVGAVLRAVTHEDPK